jgi:hypothetical protein
MNKEFRFIGWEEIEKSCLSMYSQMCCRGYKPQAVIALLRGGVIPGRILSDYFNIMLDFFALDVTLYSGIGETKSEPSIKPFTGDIHGKKILIIDDIWDSGKTMNAVLDYLGTEDITTATLFWKELANNKPTYYSEIAKMSEWIIFPWERYEFYREIGDKLGNIKERI